MKKLGFLFIIFLTLNIFAFADNIDDLKAAISSKDISKVQILLESAPSDQVNVYEKEILAKAKEYVANDELDYASSLAEVVVMVNIDNVEARKLYTSIEKAKKAKAETLARKEAEEKKRQEEERKKAEAEEQKRQLEEFKAQKEKEEKEQKEFIESVSSVSFSNFPMSFGFALPLDFTKSTFADEFNGNKALYTRLGVGLVANVAFVHPYVNIGLHVNYNFLPVAFMKGGMKSDLKTRITLGLPMFSNWFRLSTGFNSYSLINNSSVVLYEMITAPTFGIGVEKVKFTDFLELSFFTDLNLITFDKHSEINYAFDTELNLRYYLPVDAFGMGKLYVESKNFLNNIILSKQSEWYLTSTISVGVSINE